jgi:hypothetical protein
VEVLIVTNNSAIAAVTIHAAPDGMTPAFSHWRSLTDAYAKQLEALRRMEPGASARLNWIGAELALCNASFTRESRAN